MKYIHTDNWVSKIQGGINLYPFEELCIDELINIVPNPIKDTLIEQFKMLNLGQREVDSRALNFYRIKWGILSTKNIPKLSTKQQETKLLKIEITLNNKDNIHINYWVVNGIFFQITFNKDISKYKNINVLNVTKVVKAWQSNINI